jgi:hypothetical protein
MPSISESLWKSAMKFDVSLKSTIKFLPESNIHFFPLKKDGITGTECKSYWNSLQSDEEENLPDIDSTVIVKVNPNL